MPDDPTSSSRTWFHRFRDAFRGMKAGVRGQSSFFVHFVVGAVVAAAGAVLGVNLYEWCLLLLCIAGVMAAEMFNSSLESMAKAVTHEEHPHVGNSLDIAAAAVLVASLGASAVGIIIFVHRLAVMLGWWQRQ